MCACKSVCVSPCVSGCMGVRVCVKKLNKTVEFFYRLLTGFISRNPGANKNGAAVNRNIYPKDVLVKIIFLF